MPYYIILLVKQVPDTANVSAEAMRDDGTVNRGALPAIFNPEDLNALETALDAQLAPVADGADLVDGAVYVDLQVEQQGAGEQRIGAWSGGWRGGLGHPGRRAGLRLAALASKRS